jgi:hypothetical protein
MSAHSLREVKRMLNTVERPHDDLTIVCSQTVMAW